MAKVELADANIYFGLRKYPIDLNETNPFKEFDLNRDIMEQVFEAMAIMSNAAGGHVLGQAKVTIHSDRYVGINGGGFNVRWGKLPMPDRTKSIEEQAKFLEKTIRECRIFDVPFAVLASGRGQGWKHAKKILIH